MNNEKKQPVNGDDLLEVKKNKDVDINRRKTTWILIGFIMVLALVFVVFEYTSREEQEVFVNDDVVVEVTLDYVPPSKPIEPQPLPQPKSKKVAEKIEIIEEEEEVDVEETLVVEETEVVDVVSNDVVYVEPEVVEEPILNVVENMPEFPGGMQELMKYLQKNINYPRVSRDNGSQGKVIVNFVVETDGSITDVQVLKSSGDPLLDKEAIRVVEAMPKWKPGNQAGKAVRVRFTLPVQFRLAR